MTPLKGFFAIFISLRKRSGRIRLTTQIAGNRLDLGPALLKAGRTQPCVSAPPIKKVDFPRFHHFTFATSLKGTSSSDNRMNANRLRKPSKKYEPIASGLWKSAAMQAEGSDPHIQSARLRYGGPPRNAIATTRPPLAAAQSRGLAACRRHPEHLVTNGKLDELHLVIAPAGHL
ncbi:MAG TPA: hypothetical protein VNQ56_00245 [Pseudolabrys sp.]|nr:hypothetical protein [Pseudolabrys sp.]